MEKVSDLRRRAGTLAAAGKNRRAARLYERVLELEPRNPQVAHRLAELRRKIGDLRGAQMYFWRAAELYRAVGLEGKSKASERVRDEIGKELGRGHRSPWWRSLFRMPS